MRASPCGFRQTRAGDVAATALSGVRRSRRSRQRLLFEDPSLDRQEQDPKARKGLGACPAVTRLQGNNTGLAEAGSINRVLRLSREAGAIPRAREEGRGASSAVEYGSLLKCSFVCALLSIAPRTKQMKLTTKTFRRAMGSAALATTLATAASAQSPSWPTPPAPQAESPAAPQTKTAVSRHLGARNRMQ
jgi:hypothetical protein